MSTGKLKNLSNNMSNSFINKLYNYGIKSGAYGGKIIGAGGGGYIMFVLDSKKKFYQKVQKV